MAATTENIELSRLPQVFEPLRVASAQVTQTAQRIGPAIVAVNKSLPIPPFNIPPVVQAMINARAGDRRAIIRLADALLPWFQIPRDVHPTLKRKKISDRELIINCTLQIMARSENMPIRKFEDGRTGPTISFSDFTPREVIRWMIAEVYRSAMSVTHGESIYYPELLVFDLPDVGEPAIWPNELGIWQPYEGQQLNLPVPYNRPGPKNGPRIPPDFEKGYLKALRELFDNRQRNGDTRPLSYRAVAEHLGSPPAQTLQNWVENHLHLPRPWDYPPV